ncbi:MAG: recombinase family protein [Planctomycetes bacterium]|nr:recombinase family protein [Planctomycetota bacterium]
MAQILPCVTSAARFPRPTCVGYCRVSTTEQAAHGWSIEQQEDSIRAWAAAQGLDLVAVFRDAGRSGRTMQRRSGLLAMLELVHQRGIGVVVAKAQDRLARAVDHDLGLRHWLHRHGTDLLFLDGDIHLRAADAGGGGNLGADLIASLTAVLAEEEVATLRRRIIPNLAQAARNGHRGGWLPLGYRRLPDGSVVVEPHDAGLVQQAVEAVLAGTGLSQLSRTWVASGFRDHQGAIITFDRLRGALTNAYLLGELRYHLPPEGVGADGVGDVRIPAHHPNLLDPVTFGRVQLALRQRGRSREPADTLAARRERRRIQRRSNRLPASGDLLQALRPPAKPVHGAVSPDALRCGICDGPMYASLMTVGGIGKRTKRAVYICRYHKDRGAAFCAQKPVPADDVDEAVFAIVHSQLRSWSLSDPDDATGGTPRACGPASTADDAPVALDDLQHAEATRDRLQAMVTQLGDRAPQVLQDRLAVADAEVIRVSTQVQRQHASRFEPTGPAWSFRRRPQETWAALDTAGRRVALTPLLARVVVRDRVVTTVTMRGADGHTHVAPCVEPERS